MKQLFIDCSSGVAGDMFSAALLDLFPNKEEKIEELNRIGIPDVEFSAEKVCKHSIAGIHLTVKYKEQKEKSGYSGGKHSHRGIEEILHIIDRLNLSSSVKNDVKAVYASIAQAEAEIHDAEPGEIHFHELGTMDAIADICAACYLINELSPERITISPVCMGFGNVKCAHGVMPVPAPATALLLKDVPSFAGDIEGELCTPTGAALVKHFASGYGHQPEMTVTGIGRGMGEKDFGKLSCVIAKIGECEETIIELSCNVDDMTPEAVGFAIDELLRAGAPDAYYVPIGMKKNRPGVILSCLCKEQQRDEMVRLMFKHTSTIGIRETLFRRYVLKRHEEAAETPFGNVRVKVSEGYGVLRRKAEYEDLARLARDNSLSISDVKACIDRD